MTEKTESAKAQQQTLSVRITDSMRARLERARRMAAAKSGEFVSTSEIAKQLLETARDDRLEVVDLLADPHGTLLAIRRKAEAKQMLSRAEWIVVAQFVQHGIAAAPGETPNPVSRESLAAVLDAFLAVCELRTDPDSRLNAVYLAHLPPECVPQTKRGDRETVPFDVVRRAVTATRRQVTDPKTTWRPTLVGRSLQVLLDEDKLRGAADITEALAPFWPVLWRLAARGHYVLTQTPIRAAERRRDGLYQPPLPVVRDGALGLAFARSDSAEFSVVLDRDRPGGPRYPIVGYPQIAEFRTMVAEVAADLQPGDWSGTHFFADVVAAEGDRPLEVWFRAHANGISIGFSADEWRVLADLFRRAWELPELRRAWTELSLEYGEL